MIPSLFSMKQHPLLLIATLALILTLETNHPHPALAADEIRFTVAEVGVYAQSELTAPAMSSKSNTRRKTETKRTATKKTPVRTPSKKRASTGRRSAKAQLDAAVKLPWPENVKTLAGTGAVLVTDPHHDRGQPTELFALNADQAYVPASIVKLVTAGAALDALGPDYRFQTDFYLDDVGGLWIVGRGDPFLVSEEICVIAQNLKNLGLTSIGDVNLDTSFFEPDLVLDGVTYTANPYDAFNGALGVNFNTVNFLIDTGGRIVESDECTPLTPMALELAAKNVPKKRGKKVVERRVNISESPKAAELQAGQFFKAALERAGVVVAGEVVQGGVLPSDAKPVYSHANSLNLREMLVVLLEHSNNFMTNQIFLTMGAEKFGAPANLEKGLRVFENFLDANGLPKLNLVEGSGLSRNNTVTAREMAEILQVLEPARDLLKSVDEGAVRLKTGTMYQVQTLAGYIDRPDRPDEPLNFVILLNGPYQNGVRELILQALRTQFIGAQSSSGA